jgi:hypothetical protein
MTELELALQELADMKAGIPSHEHTKTDGTRWRCTSPYCPPHTTQGGARFDGPPQGAPNDAADTKHYARGTIA